MASTYAAIQAARRSGSGRKPDQGPGDLVKADRAAGRNIQRDDYSWTVATPEEFRAGMSETARRSSRNGGTGAFMRTSTPRTGTGTFLRTSTPRTSTPKTDIREEIRNAYRNSKRPKGEETMRKKSGPSQHSTTSASTHGYFGGDTNENRMTRDKILDAYKKRRGGGKA